jgi:hypothetical protein
MSAELGGIPISEHTMDHRKMIVNTPSPQHRLRQRDFGAIVKGGLPHSEPGAESRNVILFNEDQTDERMLGKNEAL